MSSWCGATLRCTSSSSPPFPATARYRSNFEFFIVFLLPPIIFEAGFNMNVEAFFMNAGPTMFFAFVGCRDSHSGRTEMAARHAHVPQGLRMMPSAMVHTVAALRCSAPCPHAPPTPRGST